MYATVSIYNFPTPFRETTKILGILGEKSGNKTTIFRRTLGIFWSFWENQAIISPSFGKIPIKPQFESIGESMRKRTGSSVYVK